MPYYDQPNYTMVPNQLLDFDMAELSRCELTVLLYIVRHTLGFGKTMDAISYKQFMQGVWDRSGRQLDKGTGIKSRTHLAEALASLEKRGCICRERRDPHVSAETAAEKTVYRLCVDRGDTSAPAQLRVVGGTAGKEANTAGATQPRAEETPPAPSTAAAPPSTLTVLPPSTATVLPPSAVAVPPLVPSRYPQKKGNQKKSNQKKQERGVRAATPAPQRRARDHLEMVATTDDPKAPRERRLALKLAGDVLGCASVNVERLACYERFCAGLLAHDYTAADLCRWMDWMNSGTAYWVGNARRWTQQRMMDDLADWEGHGRPAGKEDGDG